MTVVMSEETVYRHCVTHPMITVLFLDKYSAAESLQLCEMLLSGRCEGCPHDLSFRRAVRYELDILSKDVN